MSSPRKPTPEHDTSQLGLGLVLGDEAMFFAFEALGTKDLPVSMTLGGEPIKVFYEPDALTAWAEDASGALLNGVLVYREGWKEFFPDSKMFR